MGKGSEDDRSDQSLFTMGLGMPDYVFEAIDQADLILTVGYDLGEYSPERWNPKGDKKIIHIDFTSADSYGQYQPAVEIVADTRATLREIHRDLLKHKTPPYDERWYRPIRQKILADIESYDLKDGQPFTVPGVLNILRGILRESDILDQRRQGAQTLDRPQLPDVSAEHLLDLQWPGEHGFCLARRHRRGVAASQRRNRRRHG